MSDAEENKCFTFWENWYLLAEGRDTDEKRLAFYDALFRFAFECEVPPKPKRGDPATIWAAYDAYLAASQTISRNMDLREQGRHGGKNGRGESKARVGNQNARKHPKTQAETQAKTEAKQKPNASQTQVEDASQTQENKINIKENIDDDVGAENANQNAKKFVLRCVNTNPPTVDEAIAYGKDVVHHPGGKVYPEEWVKDWYTFLSQSNPPFTKRGTPIGDWRQKMISDWQLHEKELRKENKNITGRQNGHREGLADGLGF